jgi:hypothetical protein
MSVKWLNIADYYVESRLDISKEEKKQSWKPSLNTQSCQASTEKKIGPIMSNNWGQFFYIFMTKKNIF